MINFTEKEWMIIRDAVESEGFLVPEEESDDYAIIIDKIDSYFEDARNIN